MEEPNVVLLEDPNVGLFDGEVNDALIWAEWVKTEYNNVFADRGPDTGMPPCVRESEMDDCAEWVIKEDKNGWYLGCIIEANNEVTEWYGNTRYDNVPDVREAQFRVMTYGFREMQLLDYFQRSNQSEFVWPNYNISAPILAWFAFLVANPITDLSG